MQGAGLNSAISVSVVRDFLSGPALVLRNPVVPFALRSKSRQFEIDAYAIDHRLLDELTVTLSLTDKADNPRTLTAMRAGNRFVAEGPACPPDAAPLELVLVVHKGRGTIKAKLPPDAFSIGSRKFAWSNIDSLTKDNDAWIVSLHDGQRFAGKAVGLPAVSFGSGRTTQLATADRIEVRLENPPPTVVAYELKAHRGPTEFTPETGVLRITNSPKGLLPNFEEPLGATQLSEPIVIEAVVPQTLAIGVSPNGLVWMPAQVPPPDWKTIAAATFSWTARNGTTNPACPSCQSSWACAMSRSICSGHAPWPTVPTTRTASRSTSKGLHWPT